MSHTVHTALLPAQGGGFVSCLLHPGNPEHAWVGGDQIRSEAIALELDPEPRQPVRWTATNTYDQEWPKDVVRIAASLGHEASLSSTELPFLRKEVLRPSTKWFWHHLTFAFVDVSLRQAPLEHWRAFRTTVMETLLPAKWDAPPGLIALLHIAEADYLQVLSRDPELLHDWVLHQLRLRPDAATLPHWERELRGAVKWLMEQAMERGARLMSIEMVRRDGRDALQIRGRWGVGEGSLIQGGERSGEHFAATWVPGDDSAVMVKPTLEEWH